MPHNRSIETLMTDTGSMLRDRYRIAPQQIALAPGRVNLIGEHTDYNSGLVLPIAIQRATAIAFAETPSDATNPTLTICSSSQPDPLIIRQNDPRDRVPTGWHAYVEGVVREMSNRGWPQRNVFAAIDSTVPIGSGLSSSAALEVATALMYQSVIGQTIDRRELANLCQRAEHRYAGVPCGLMDQWASLFGNDQAALLIDFGRNTIEPIPFNSQDVVVLIVDTRVRHQLGQTEYATRRSECESAAKHLGLEHLSQLEMSQLDSAVMRLPEGLARRCRHVVSENQRVREFAEALTQQDWHRAGRLMYASHASLRDDYAVSCAELDFLVETSNRLGVDAGVFGARMTGGGFGGCSIHLVDSRQAQFVSDQLAKAYEFKFGIRTEVFATHPAPAAQLFSISGGKEQP